MSEIEIFEPISRANEREARKTEINTVITEKFLLKRVRKTGDVLRDGTTYTALDVIDYHVLRLSERTGVMQTRSEVLGEILDAYEFEPRVAFTIGCLWNEYETIENPSSAPRQSSSPVSES